MEQKVSVPLVGTDVISPNNTAEPAGERPQQQPQEREIPDGARRSLHQVKFPRQAAESNLVPDWDQFGRVKFVEAPATNPEQSYQGETTMADKSDLEQQVQQLTQVVFAMAQDRFGNDQQTKEDTSDSEDFNYYAGDEDLAKIVRREIQAALAPHEESLANAKYSSQYNRTLADHKDDPDFKQIMDIALQVVDKSNGQVSIPEAYERVKQESAKQNKSADEQELPASLKKSK